MRRRLDVELVERGLARSRSEAQRAIDAGRVRVDGLPARKPATMVAREQSVSVAVDRREWASRGGEKLDAALDHFAVDVDGADALDVGASTGGFTDVLLRRGAARVVALDVGYGQLAWRLRRDRRVEVRDRVNFRLVDPSEIGAPFDVVTVDVSFIGIGLIAEQIAACCRPGSAALVLVKPQFEVGRERVGRGGIVTDPAAHRDAVASAAGSLHAAGLGVVGAMPSPILGAKGNREFFVHAVLGAQGRSRDEVAQEALR
jgi:23S rRNA (cytidine1920-2'-O)/16S rRNA (cytidine1409-2'-O)-methyltransferase